MRISITGSADAMSKRFQNSARHQLIRAFGNYASSIVCITAELSEERSANGGLQRHCQIHLRLLGFGVLTAEAWDDNPLAAVIRAADRARQKMFSHFDRPCRQVV